MLLAPFHSYASENLFYYFDNTNGLSSFKKNYRNIDIINPQVYEVNYDLKIDKPSGKKVKDLLRTAKKKKVDVMPLLVNKDFDKVLMSDILINSKAQDEIIDFMIKEAKKNKYIGWQFDFENINHLDRKMYTAFVKKTYERLQKENLKFSVAVIPRSKDYDVNSKDQDWSSAYEYSELAKNSDFLSLMTYDDPNTFGPVASTIYVEKVLNYLKKTVPAEKMSLGVPAYCYEWQENPRKKIGATTYELAEKKYKKGNNKTRGFDSYFGAEWFRFENNGIKQEIWCDNVDSWKLKQDIVKNYGLRGISVWALGQEDSRVWKKLK